MTDQSTTSDLAEQIKAIQSDLLTLTETIRSYTREQASVGADAAQDAVQKVTETASSAAEEVRRRGERIAEDIEDRIAAKPLPAVLIAAGVGLVFGAILTRR